MSGQANLSIPPTNWGCNAHPKDCNTQSNDKDMQKRQPKKVKFAHTLRFLRFNKDNEPAMVKVNKKLEQRNSLVDSAVMVTKASDEVGGVYLSGCRREQERQAKQGF